MKHAHFLVFALCLLFLASCASIDVQGSTGTLKENPAPGLRSGSISTLSQQSQNELIEKLGCPQDKMALLKKAMEMMKNDYRHTSPVDGARVRDINTIISTKTLRHCGEYGVLWLGILRLYGVPCVYIQTLRVEDVDSASSWGGHVFIESLIDDEIILIDSTMGLIYRGYDETMKIIPVTVGGSFARKGLIEMFRCYDPAEVMRGRDFTFAFYVDRARDYYRRTRDKPDCFLEPIKP